MGHHAHRAEFINAEGSKCRDEEDLSRLGADPLLLQDDRLAKGGQGKPWKLWDRLAWTIRKYELVVNTVAALYAALCAPCAHFARGALSLSSYTPDTKELEIRAAKR